MDPAGIGALLGCSILFSCFVFVRICDLYEKRKKSSITLHTPLLVQTHRSLDSSTLAFSTRSHWKVQKLGLPAPIRTIVLSSTTSGTATI